MQDGVDHRLPQCLVGIFGLILTIKPTKCQSSHYSYHSCRNRHCPTCQHQAAQQWLACQQALLLPVPYFLVTFTLPSGLRDAAYRHQRLVYDAFFRASAAALQQLAKDPRFVGAQIGMLGVLQTWTRDLRYHPHIHYLVGGGGLSESGQNWVASKADFFVPVKPLSRLFRAKLRSALRETGERRLCRLEALAFLHRYLQHVLPKGFVKVRYYGLFRVGARRELARLRGRLWLQAGLARLEAMLGEAEQRSEVRELRCPRCGAVLRLERELARVRAPPQSEQQN